MAVVDRPVPFVEKTVIDQQIAELHALVALSAPRDLVTGAGPILLGKDRPAAFAHLPVEAGVVGDHHRGVGSEGLHGGIINPLASHIGVSDPGQPGDLRRDRLFGLVQLVERLEHPVDAPARAILEFEDAELDHVVGGVVGAGGLGVEHQSDERWLVGRICAFHKRCEPAQHAVIPVLSRTLAMLSRGSVHVDASPSFVHLGCVSPQPHNLNCKLSLKSAVATRTFD